MAKKNAANAAAAKAKKQKMILIFGGVALLGLGALQGPKLMKRGGEAEVAAPPVAAVAVATGTPTPAAPSPTTGSAAPAGTVAGVSLPGVTAVRVNPSQLASFTLFDIKDPFVQQAGDEPAAQTDTAAPPPSDSAAPAPSASGSAGATPPPPAAPKIKYATINLDGKPQQLVVKEEFPKADPMFVLVSVAKKKAKIGVAGGSFDNGETITLTLGKKLTLVNTATSVRYELKLVYTGSEPETIEGFSPPPADGQQSTTVDVTVPPATTTSESTP